MHINYHRNRNTRNEDNNGHINNHVPIRFIRRNHARECNVCGLTSENTRIDWHRGPGGCNLCNRCQLKYRQILTIEDPFRNEIENLNRQSPMLFIKIIFVITFNIPIARYKQIYNILYNALNNLSNNNDIFITLDNCHYLKVKDNLFEFLYIRE